VQQSLTSALVQAVSATWAPQAAAASAASAAAAVAAAFACAIAELQSNIIIFACGIIFA